MKTRKLKISDVKELKKLLNNKEVLKNIDGINYPCSLEDIKKYVLDSINKNKKKESYEFLILKNKTPVGTAVLENPNKSKTIYELGYFVGRKYWNKGIATESIKKIIMFGFNILKIKKIWAGTLKSNPASGRVLEKSEFKLKKKNKKELIWEIKK